MLTLCACVYMLDNAIAVQIMCMAFDVNSLWTGPFKATATVPSWVGFASFRELRQINSLIK